MIDYDLLLNEAEMDKSKEAIEKICKHINEKMNTYISSIEVVVSEGITEGEIHERLQLYVDTLQELKDEILEIQHTIKATIEQYQIDFDVADDALF